MVLPMNLYRALVGYLSSKLYAYGFDRDSPRLMQSYSSRKYQKTKVNRSEAR